MYAVYCKKSLSEFGISQLPWKGQRGEVGAGSSWGGGKGAELWEEPSQSSFRREKPIGTHGTGGQGIVFERLASSNAVDTTGAAKETAC